MEIRKKSRRFSSGEGDFRAAELAASWVRSKLVGALGKIRLMKSLEYPRKYD